MPVKERCGFEANEKLRIGAVDVCSAGHRHGTTNMAQIVKLGLEVFARATGAGAGRVAGLRHEAFDHAMKHDAVVKALTRQFLDTCNGFWRFVGTQLDHYRAILQLEQ